ncbi:MAG: hypothetical protein H7335_17010 [Massilia sp.]|nr:hypothetical protein [Massilia sp.]
MTKTSTDPREQQRQAAEKAQQEASRNQQKAHQEEVAGRHKNDGQKDHEGADKGPRGQ